MLFIRKKGVFTLSATIVLFFTFTQVLSQNNTIFTNYNKKDYKGGNQNWSICVGEAQMLFAANNQGLLFYNGASWKRHHNCYDRKLSDRITLELVYVGTRGSTGNG